MHSLSEPPHPGRYALLYTLRGRVLTGGTTRYISRHFFCCRNCSNYCHFLRRFVLFSPVPPVHTLSEPPHPGRYSLLYTLRGRVLTRCHRCPLCQNPHTLAVTLCYTLYVSWFWQVAPPGAFPAFCRNCSHYCLFRPFHVVPPVHSLSEPPHLGRYSLLYTLPVVVLAGATRCDTAERGATQGHFGIAEIAATTAFFVRFAWCHQRPLSPRFAWCHQRPQKLWLWKSCGCGKVVVVEKLWLWIFECHFCKPGRPGN